MIQNDFPLPRAGEGEGEGEGKTPARRPHLSSPPIMPGNRAQ